MVSISWKPGIPAAEVVSNTAVVEARAATGDLGGVGKGACPRGPAFVRPGCIRINDGLLHFRHSASFEKA